MILDVPPPPAEPSAVLTKGFPSAMEMITWLWNHCTEWLMAHLLLSIVATFVVLVAYVVVVFRRSLASI